MYLRDPEGEFLSLQRRRCRIVVLSVVVVFVPFVLFSSYILFLGSSSSIYIPLICHDYAYRDLIAPPSR
jgi:hypothetical protein